MLVVGFEKYEVSRYMSVRPFSNGFAAVKDAETELWGFISKDGEEVLPCIYEEARDFNNGISSVKKDGTWFRINTYGLKTSEEYIKPKYEKATAFNEDLSIVIVDGIYTIIDEEGNTIKRLIREKSRLKVSLDGTILGSINEIDIDNSNSISDLEVMKELMRSNINNIDKRIDNINKEKENVKGK